MTIEQKDPSIIHSFICPVCNGSLYQILNDYMCSKLCSKAYYDMYSNGDLMIQTIIIAEGGTIVYFTDNILKNTSRMTYYASKGDWRDVSIGTLKLGTKSLIQLKKIYQNHLILQ